MEIVFDKLHSVHERGLFGKRTGVHRLPVGVIGEGSGNERDQSELCAYSLSKTSYSVLKFEPLDPLSEMFLAIRTYLLLEATKGNRNSLCCFLFFNSYIPLINNSKGFLMPSTLDTRVFFFF